MGTARRLAAGELSARSDRAAISGVTEVQELGEALDSMAASLGKQMRRTELIVNSAGEGICGLDRDGCVTFVNPAANAEFGFEPAEMVGQNFHRLVHHSRADGSPFPEEECPVLGVLRGAHTLQDAPDVFWCKDHTSVPVEYTATP